MSNYSLEFLLGSEQLCASDTTNSVCIYDVADGQVLRKLPGNDSEICCIAVSPNQKYMATGLKDNTVCLFDFDSGKGIAVLRAHKSWVWGVEFSPDSQRLYSASRDCTVAVWGIPEGELLTQKQIHEDEINGLALSSDGNFLATGSDDNKIILSDTTLSWIFRLMTPGDSERIRPGIPSDDAHPFRGIAATHSD